MSKPTPPALSEYVKSTLKRAGKALFWFTAVFVFLTYGTLAAYVAASRIRYETDAGNLSSAEIDRLESRLEGRLKAGDYGAFSHATWSDLFAQSFYAYGRANRYDRHPDETKRQALVAELERVLSNIETVQLPVMNRGMGATRLEGGIIYQWHRLRVLALLAKYRGDDETKTRLKREADVLAAALEKAPRRTEESYPGWAWWVDNVDAYAALAIADGVLGTSAYAALGRDWTDEMERHGQLEKNDVLLAEAYGPYMAQNQARSPATAWMVPSLALFDPEYANDQVDDLNRHFSDEFLGMPTMREVPKGQKLVNTVGTGPVIFGVSSAGTMLAVPAYASMGDAERAAALERTVRTLFWYDRGDGSLFFGISTLLESVFYWSVSFR